MSSSHDLVPIEGSERAPLPGAHSIGPADPNEQTEVTVIVRRPMAAAALPDIAAMGAQLPQQRQYLSREELAAAQAAAPDDLRAVEDFATAHGLTVVQVSAPRRTVVLAGTVAAMSTAFGVQLEQYETPGGRYRGRTGPVQIPSTLDGIVVGVLGLDDRPQARPSVREADALPAAQTLSFTPPQLAQLYAFPPGTTGEGECIGIIELGGGFRKADLTAYFAALNIPTPRVTAVAVSGGRNHPTNAKSADGEVMLDIDVAGAVAPDASIVVYFAPNTSQGFLNAITTAVHDAHNRPSVLSISWGQAESGWTPQAMQAMDQAFQDAATLGVTVFCASGDDGSSDRIGDGLAHADFPASSPHVLACGGTHISGSGTPLQEEVWNESASGGGASGGGVSDIFELPSYQSNAHVPPSVNTGGPIGRGVPDIAGNASPRSGYQVRVDGQNLVFGGTSAVAPLWAGLTALLNQSLGTPVGFLNPLLYNRLLAAGAFNDITSGNNGGYDAGSGWDACTGLGTPRGETILATLRGH